MLMRFMEVVITGDEEGIAHVFFIVVSDIHRDQKCTLHVHLFVHSAALFPFDQLLLDVRRG